MDHLIKQYKNNILYIYTTVEELFNAAALDFTQRAIDSVKNKDEFTVVLSGGSTPKAFYDSLTSLDFCKTQTPWGKIKFFFGDERFVPLDNSQSNYFMAYQHLFSKVPILEKNIYPIKTNENDPKSAANDYQTTIDKALNLKEGAIPNFDVIYLGLGEDGHTASLMPSSDLVRACSNNIDNDNYVIFLWASKLSMYRITLTPPAINNATNIIFLVTGINKASAVCRVLKGPYNPNQTPAQLIQGLHKDNSWYLDKEAAIQIH